MIGEAVPPSASSAVPLTRTVLNAVVSGEGAEAIGADQPLPTPEEISDLCQHGLAGVALHLFADRAREAGGQAFDELTAVVQRGVASRLAMADALGEIGEALQKAGIPAATTRAFGRVQQLYPTPECRLTSDLDLVVQEEDFDGFREQVLALGFRPAADTKEWCFVRGRMLLDVAKRPTDLVRVTGIDREEDTFALLDQDWVTRLVPGPCSGIGLFPVARETLLGALHYGYKHRYARHIWGLDLMLLVKSMSEDEVRALTLLAEETRSAALLEHALGHAAAICDRPVRQSLAGSLGRVRAPWLQRYLLELCATRNTSPDTGLLVALVSATSWRFRVQLLTRMCFPFATRNAASRKAHGSVSVWTRIRHAASLPGRFLGAVRH